MAVIMVIIVTMLGDSRKQNSLIETVPTTNVVGMARHNYGPP